MRIHADIGQNHTYPTPKIQTLVVVVHATVPNPERRLEHSSRGGEQGEREKGDVRGVVELWLRRKVRASRLRAFYGFFPPNYLIVYVIKMYAASREPRGSRY
jgi:hypothetical protein